VIQIAIFYHQRSWSDEHILVLNFRLRDRVFSVLQHSEFSGKGKDIQRGDTRAGTRKIKDDTGKSTRRYHFQIILVCNILSTKKYVGKYQYSKYIKAETYHGLMKENQ